MNLLANFRTFHIVLKNLRTIRIIRIIYFVSFLHFSLR